MAIELAIHGLCAGYGPVEVLHDVDLAVPAGSTVALLGANAAGKSTLLRCIVGVVPLRAGTIRWAGRSIAHRSPYDRASAGLVFVPDERNVFESLTVAETLELFAGGGPSEPAFEAFGELGRLRHRRVGTLSGGERQMVAICRALVRPGRLRLFDEVSRGLAPAVVARCYDAIARSRAPEGADVIVEQYLADALRVADLVYVLRRGEVVFAGEPGELGAMAGRYGV